MPNQYKILIIAPQWVGDIVIAHGLFQTLYIQYADRLVLDVYAPDWAHDLIARMPEVNECISYSVSHGKLNLYQRIKDSKYIRERQYQQVFVLTNSFKSALIPFLARIKKRTGFIGEQRYFLLNDIYKLNKSSYPRLIDRFVALAYSCKLPSYIPVPKLRIDANQQLILLQRFNLNPNVPIIALCPGAEYGVSKRWPVKHFAALIDLIMQHNYQVIILGGPKDTMLGNEILHNTQYKPLNLCGQTILAEVIDIIGCAKYVVTNDSGLMHIASAVAIPVIAVYGSSSYKYTPPLAKNAQVVSLELECSPCFQRTCRYGHYKCLTDITPLMIYKLLHLN